MKKNIFVLTFLALSCGSAYAATGSLVAISTQELVSVCNERSSSESKTYCDIYGQGVYDTYLVTRHPKGAPDFICVNQPAPPRREVMVMYVNWSSANPQYNSAPAADTFLRFLATKFPCEASSMSPNNDAKKIIR
jgi:hypothetical protein